MNRKLLLGMLVASTWLSVSACASHGYYARVPPPPPPGYAIGFAPGPGYVWCDGYWDLRGRDWRWMRGRWMRPPRPYAVWVPSRWVPRPYGWRFRAGYWRYR